MTQFFTSTSRVLAALLFVALTTESAAQSFPLPYNPDENGDGLIGVVDLQGLLSNYGSEFSSAVLSEDGESAITYIGDMAYPLCAMACENLPGMWEMPDVEDLGLVWDEVYTGNSTVNTWLKRNGNDGTQEAPYFYSASSFQLSDHNAVKTNQIAPAWRCYCAAKQLPRVEYSYCSGGEPSEEAFNQCISEKLSQGWYPLSGFPMEHSRQAGGTSAFYNGTSYDSQTHASFWRWEQ